MREKIVEPGTKPRPDVLPASELGSYGEFQLQAQLIARRCSVSIGHATHPAPPERGCSVTRVSPALLRLAAAKNAAASPLKPHHRTALACRSYADLLTPGDHWFLGAVLKLSALSASQQEKLNLIAAAVERGRK